MLGEILGQKPRFKLLPIYLKDRKQERGKRNDSAMVTEGSVRLTGREVIRFGYRKHLLHHFDTESENFWENSEGKREKAWEGTVISVRVSRKALTTARIARARRSDYSAHSPLTIMPEVMVLMVVSAVDTKASNTTALPPHHRTCTRLLLLGNHSHRILDFGFNTPLPLTWLNSDKYCCCADYCCPRICSPSTNITVRLF